MTILKNDYLYNYIIKFILNYFYSYTLSNLPSTTPYAFDDNLTHCFYETVQYSLVSKKFFQIVSTNLRNLLKFKNYDILKRFIEKRNSESSSLYSLIKLEGSTIIYNSLEDYERDESLGLICKFRKCLVSLEGSLNSDYRVATIRSINYLLSSKVYPDNVQFNIELSLKGNYNSSGNNNNNNNNDNDNDNDNDSINSELFNYDFNLLLNNISKKRISILYIDHFNRDNFKIFQNLCKLNPKHIVYINEDEDDLYYTVSLEDYHSNFSPFLQSSTLKTLEFENDYLDTHELLEIDNSKTSLKELHLLMRFNALIRNLNGDKYSFCNNGYGNISGGSTISYLASRDNQKDWDDFINILSNNKTIKYLILEEKNYDNGRFDSTIKTSYITTALKLLFSNPNCSIETLELNRIEFLDTLFIGGLKRNKSISTLSLIGTCLRLIVYRVLPYNKSIQNLILYKIKMKDVFDLFKILKIYQVTKHKIELYSITLHVDFLSRNQLEIIQNEIQNNSFSIKELNIYIKRVESNSSIPQEIINNTIINYRYK